MESINITPVGPALKTALFGTGPGCVALAVRGAGWRGGERSPFSSPPRPNVARAT
jgi:hypothetical protein